MTAVKPMKVFTLRRSVYVQQLHTLNSEWYKLKICPLLESY